ncbi:MAG: ABC transporter ATP-binding protein [Caldilineae bacterium]|nr:ABC transporter ATP-binding protein [Anaerolineae bacterium]MCB0254722.1 ABC transporter ATP-binding protein [Anaerolineae bacterium]MCB9154889.1 ABC transporter ATP-binding protein [Caldilineae bacterium]
MTESPILQVQNLRKLFPAQRSGLFRSPERFVHAVDDVSFDLGRGEVLAVVGESGCGKSTLALTLLGLETPSAGKIIFEGNDVTSVSGKEQKALRRHIQMIFQDPYESLNPLMVIGEIIAEPLKVHNLAPDKAERAARVRRALEDSGLRPAENFVNRYPHELSGGQRQRVVIAGALVLEPTLLLADEPVSMLDVSIRAEILNLLADLRANRGISIVFITHDLATAAHFTDRVAVMYLGRIVELGRTRQVLANPTHPYTKALLSVIPVPNPRQRRQRIILEGDPPNPIDLPPGCRFHPRCPIAQDICRGEDPALRLVAPAQQAACLLA